MLFCRLRDLFDFLPLSNSSPLPIRLTEDPRCAFIPFTRAALVVGRKLYVGRGERGKERGSVVVAMSSLPQG